MFKTTFAAVAAAWQLPGLVPKNYEKDDMLDIFVGQMFSQKSSLTFDYYMLKWCENRL
jgi:hypothetical protein